MLGWIQSLTYSQDVRVVELLATVIEEMVHGEIMQVRAGTAELLDFDHYLSKTYSLRRSPP